MPRRSPRLRPPRGGREQAAAAAVACAALWLLAKIATATWQAAVRIWPWLAVLAALALGYAAWRFIRELQARKVRAQTLARLRITLA